MRLLYITNQICGSGGLERVLSIKASYLADQLGYEVHIVTLNQGDAPLFYTFSKKLIYHDISLQGKFISYSYRYAKRLNQLIKKVAPDVISVCDDGLKGLLLPLVLDKNIPKIYERHVPKNIEIDITKSKLVQKFKELFVFRLMDFGARKYDKFIVLTKGNVLDWGCSNVITIPNPLPFVTSNYSSLKNKRVLVVGRHAEYKGYENLLVIWEKLSKSFPDWTLDIYGKFDNSRRYIKLAKVLKIEETVNFFQPVKNIEDIFHSASVYAMTSRFEGFGMVLIEAMAYGVPCVSFDCPYGPNDIIENNEDGFLIEPDDLEQFYEKLSLLMNDYDLRLKMGRKAREKALIYSIDNIMPLWDILFKQLVNG